jgi:hypothetical protein
MGCTQSSTCVRLGPKNSRSIRPKKLFEIALRWSQDGAGQFLPYYDEKPFLPSLSNVVVAAKKLMQVT